MMANCLLFLLTYAIVISSVRADGLSDFSNNLASDLGPLLSLFGDAVTRQYLSESTSFIDYFIFAMAPIGIISTITAAIRVCGNSSLRAFIGRAQEGQGTTEAELCTSTSTDVCELFNKGGITRVLGRPDIIELVYVHDGGQATRNQPKLHLFTSYLYEKSSGSCWPRMDVAGSGNAVFNKIGHSDSEKSMELAPKPNLSLNVGIKRQPDWAFYMVAIVGFLLQGGILAFAGAAVWLLEWNLQKPNTEASRNYAPGIFITGTIVLCFGVWSCAALIGQTTNEQYYRRLPGSSDVLYWIQPGPQVIGDQTFGSFAYSDAKRKYRLNLWTSSTKDFDKNFEVAVFIAVSLVLVGYIAQFIGLRGLNAWISIAQLGITLVMSILRGILRMKRLSKNDNHVDKWHDLVGGHELDWLAFDISEQELQMELSKLLPNSSTEKHKPQGFEKKFHWYITGQHEKAIRLENTTLEDTELEAPNAQCGIGESSGRNSDYFKANTIRWHVANNNQLLQNRIRLSNLTGHFDEFIGTKSYLPWKDERVKVRAIAKRLGVAISQAAAVLLRNQANKKAICLRIKAGFSYSYYTNCEAIVVSLKMKPPTGPDQINWSVDSSQLEAILGLWLWSMASREYDAYIKRKHSSDSTRLPNKMPSPKIFRVVSACYGEQEWDDSFDADMNLWLGSGDLEYLKQSLDMSAYKSYTYSMADNWIMLDEKSSLNGQNTKEAPLRDDSEAKSFRRIDVDESSHDSVCGFQKFCGWNIIYEALNKATSEKENNTADTGRVNVKGFWVKDEGHSLLEICAQELFIALIRSMEALEFRKLDKISVSESGGNICLENPVISALAKCFTDNGLGTHSDSISCLIPSLRSQIPPYHEKVLSALTLAATKYRQKEEWNSAEVILRWACQYYHKLNRAGTDEVDYFMIALQELGELYRWSLAQMQHSARQQFGARGIEWMAAKYGGMNPIVALYGTVAEKINGKGIKSQGWIDELHHAILDRRRADALFYLCFAGNSIPHKLSRDLSPAARNGWDEIVSTLLEMKPNPNSEDEDGRTLVSRCAETGLRRSLRRLMDMNADLDLADILEMTPLAHAAEKGREDIVRLLLESGRVDPKGSGDSGERSPLWLATDHNHFNIIAELLDKGADINMKNHRGEGLLYLAIKRGNTDLVKSLLDRGLTIEWKPGLRIDPQIGETWGEQDEREYAIMELMDTRVQMHVDDPTRSGVLTKIYVHPLTWAAWRGHTDIIRLLLEDSETLKKIGDDEMREVTELLERYATLQPLRNHSDGIFSTLDIRPLSPGAAVDTQQIEFDPPYPDTPRLMIGINGLRLRGGSVDTHWEASSVSKTGFTLMQRKYVHNSVHVESADVTWMEFGAEEQEFQVGDLSLNQSNLVSGRSYEQVLFHNKFGPRNVDVVLWLSGISLSFELYKMPFIDIRCGNITTKGFDLYISGFQCSDAHVTWLAYPSNSTHIQSGILDYDESMGRLRRHSFRKKFERIPRLFWAFSHFRILHGNQGGRVIAGVRIYQIDRAGFVWGGVDPKHKYGSSTLTAQWVAFG